MNIQRDQIIKTNIDNQITKCRIIGFDVDPTSQVWVVELDNPDQDHFINRSQIIEITNESI